MFWQTSCADSINHVEPVPRFPLNLRFSNFELRMWITLSLERVGFTKPAAFCFFTAFCSEFYQLLTPLSPRINHSHSNSTLFLAKIAPINSQTPFYLLLLSLKTPQTPLFLSKPSFCFPFSSANSTVPNFTSNSIAFIPFSPLHFRDSHEPIWENVGKSQVRVLISSPWNRIAELLGRNFEFLFARFACLLARLRG